MEKQMNGFSRRQFLQSASLAMAGIALGSVACSTRVKRPNILLILADDMGYSDLGCYGSEIKTPTLDKLAEEGVRFSQFYNSARCCPSRAALLTGLYPHQAGIGGMTDTDVPIPEYQGYYKDNVITIADLLRSAGYKTYMSGKWHQGEEPEHRPVHHGFDRSFASIDGAGSYFDFKPYRNKKWPYGTELTVVEDDQSLDLNDQEFYATHLYTNYAIQYLNDHNDSQPFFMYLSYTAPHWPMHALPEDIAKYKGYYDEGWESIRESRFRRMKALGIISENTQLSQKDKADRDWNQLSPEDKQREIKLMEVYAAMIDCMDNDINKVIQLLKEKGELDNTVILFMSDNGACRAGNLAWSTYSHPRFDPHAEPGTPESFTGYGQNWANVSNTPFRKFKAQVHEGGVASPFIAWFPKRFQKGVIREELAHIVDIMPTVADLAGTQYPDTFQGKSIQSAEGSSLVPVLTGKGSLPDRPFYFEHMGHCGVIEKGWKAVRLRNQPWELYHLQKDRSEINDLAKENPKKLKSLVKKYEDWAKKNKVLTREEVEARMPVKL